jgi:hypothetical protein
MQYPVATAGSPFETAHGVLERWNAHTYVLTLMLGLSAGAVNMLEC